MSKQKGFAVISGSSTVVAKIMENGTVAFGGVGPDNKPVDMSISGSLTFGGLSGSAGVTQGGEDKVLLVGPGGVATIGQLSASQINLGADSFTAPGQSAVSGDDTIVDALTKLSSSIEALSSSLGATTATIDADNASEQSFDLTEGKLVIAGGSNLTSAVSTSAGDVTVTIDLDSEVSGLTSVSATSLTASAGVEAPKVKSASGDLTLDAGANTVKVLSALSSSGDFTTAGELTVNGPGESVFEGDLRVKGDLVVDGDTVTVNVTNLVVEDKVVLLGSGSTSATDDFGLVFGQNPSGASILAVEDGVFKLGTTTTVDGTGIGAVTAGGSLELGTLTASTEVSGSTVKAGTLTASLAQIGDLTVTGQVNLPTGSIDNYELANSSITVTAGNGLTNGGLVALGDTVTLDLDLNGLSGSKTAALVAADKIAIVDSVDNGSKLSTYENLTSSLLSDLAGTGLQSSGGKLAVKYGSNAGEAVEGNRTIAISGSSGEIEVAINGGSFGANGSLILGAAGNSIQIGLPESVTIAQNLTVGGDAVVTGSLTVNGAATLGNAASDDIKVNGKFRIARMDRTEAETEFPVVSGSYPYNGYMFYLNDADDNNAAVFKQGQKWYFCEDGEWHASPFFAV